MKRKKFACLIKHSVYNKLAQHMEQWLTRPYQLRHFVPMKFTH